ncbi:hypothetical protein ACOCJ5_10325 [Knoellia sp. CPCC 206450]|uniref:hypothetical protein n=1 Tax=Knoellia tibetensis TaxID=3404798 RepID=UPI003B4326F7
MVEPRHHTPRSDWPTRGGQAAVLASAKGRPFLPWQRRAADVALEFNPDTGLYRYRVIVLTVQRQAGKTTLVGVLGDHRCLTQPGGRVWFTMDTGKKADSWMREEHLPSLRPFGDPKKRGSRYTASLRAGEIGPKWATLGSTFLTFPPTRDGLHSKQSDLVVLSEAWAYSVEQGTDIVQAAQPTMGSRYQHELGMHGAQLLIDSTLGDDSSVFLDSYVEAGIAALDKPDGGVCIIDYGIPDDADATDLDVIREWHPAYGHTFTDDALEAAVEAFIDPHTKLFDEAGFARAYGNRATRSRVSVFPEAVITRMQAPRLEVPSRVGLGLDATPSGDRFALAAAWRDEEAHAYLEVIANGPATRETPALIAAVARARRVPVIVDRAAIGAVELVDAIGNLRGPKVKFEYTSTPEYSSACTVIKRQTFAGTVHHFGDADLVAAMGVVAERPIGDDAIGWGRKGSAGSIAEWVAATLALRAFDNLPAPSVKPVIVTSASR